MSIPWTPTQQRSVAKILDAHPPQSGRCAEAAQKILPVAREVDQGARILKILPGAHPRARYVMPKIRLEDPWFHHYTTEAARHYVDSLTGPDGTEMEQYLEAHWQYADGLNLEAA